MIRPGLVIDIVAARERVEQKPVDNSNEENFFKTEEIVHAGTFDLHVHQRGVISIQEERNRCIIFEINDEEKQINLASYFDNVGGNHMCRSAPTHEVFFSFLKYLGQELGYTVSLVDYSKKQFKKCSPINGLLVSLAKGKTFYERQGFVNLNMNKRLQRIANTRFDQFLRTPTATNEPLGDWGVHGKTVKDVATKIIEVCNREESTEEEITIAEQYARRINEIIEKMERYSKFSWKRYTIHPTRGGKWSLKYKKSINCKRPKGFSQRQHCKYGRKKLKNLTPKVFF
jgi:hypothetical protein